MVAQSPAVNEGISRSAARSRPYEGDRSRSEDSLLTGGPVLDLIIGKSFFGGRDMLVMLW
jgi:hypothetical protein